MTRYSNKILRRLVLYSWFLMLMFGYSSAFSQTLNDFAYAFPVITTGDSAVYRLQIPVEIYQKALSEQLLDVQMFDGRERPIPFAINTVSQSVSRTSKEQLAFFYIDTHSNDADSLRIYIERSETGTSIDLNSDLTSKDDLVKPLHDILIDARSQAAIHELHFEFLENSSFVTKVLLEKSNDLTDWQTVQEAVLAQVEQNGFRLNTKQIPFPATQASFFRLSIIEGDELPELSDIRTSVSSSFDLSSATVMIEPASMLLKDNTVDLDTGGYFPISAIDIQDIGTSLSNYSVYYRMTPEDDWISYRSDYFYQLRHKGQLLSSAAMTVDNKKFRYWRLAFEASIDEASTDIRFLVRPETIVFASQENEDLKLAFGLANAMPKAIELNALLKPLGLSSALQLPQAELGERLILAGEAALKQSNVLPWSTIMLWTVLILAVAILAFMALKLLAELPKQPKP